MTVESHSTFTCSFCGLVFPEQPWVLGSCPSSQGHCSVSAALVPRTGSSARPLLSSCSSCHPRPCWVGVFFIQAVSDLLCEALNRTSCFDDSDVFFLGSFHSSLLNLQAKPGTSSKAILDVNSRTCVKRRLLISCTSRTENTPPEGHLRGDVRRRKTRRTGFLFRFLCRARSVAFKLI